MVDVRLIEYVKAHLKQGYPADNLRKYLISYGYPAADVDSAIKQCQKKKSPSIQILIASAAIIVVMMLAAIAVVLLLPPQEGQDVSIKLTRLTAEPGPGEELLFNIELTNLGTTKRYDVSLTHELKTGTSVVNTKTESMPLEDSASKESSINIPADSYPGNFILTTTANFEGGKRTSSISFVVIKKQVIRPKGCPDCDDKDICTTDTCSELTGYKCAYEKKVPCCGNSMCESGETKEGCSSDCTDDTLPDDETIPIANIQEVIQGVKDAATSGGGDAAGEFCNKVSKASYKDACFEVASKEVNEPALCSFIATESKKDSCYINFAFEGNLDVCELIINKYLKKSCFALKR